MDSRFLKKISQKTWNAFINKNENAKISKIKIKNKKKKNKKDHLFKTYLNLLKFIINLMKINSFNF